MQHWYTKSKLCQTYKVLALRSLLLAVKLVIPEIFVVLLHHVNNLFQTSKNQHCEFLGIRLYTRWFDAKVAYTCHYINNFRKLTFILWQAYGHLFLSRLFSSFFLLNSSLFLHKTTIIFTAIAACLMIPAIAKWFRKFWFCKSMLAKKKLSNNCSQSWMQKENKIIKETDSKHWATWWTHEEPTLVLPRIQ